MKNIFLIGFMGCGKSTISRYMSEKYGFSILELDEEIERREDMKISQIFLEKGECYFRDLESQLILELDEQERIVSCGGGVVLRDDNIREMKSKGSIVWLKAEPKTILDRVSGDDNRPLLQGKKNEEAIREMMEKREARYKIAADVSVQTDQKDLSEICEEILEKIKE